MLTYVVGHTDGTATLVTSSATADWRVERTRLDRAPTAIVTDGNRVAILKPDGKVSIISSATGLTTSIDVGEALAIALRGDSLLAAGDRRLEQYSVTAKRRTGMWTLPDHATGVSIRYGVALVTAGHNVIALRLSDGRRVRLAHTATAPLAVIDKAGVAFASTASRQGGVTFIPMADVERALSGR